MKHWSWLILLIFFSNCQSNSRRTQYLIGSWQTDSTFNYYNGFTYRQRRGGMDWSTHVYSANGQVAEQKLGTSRNHQYVFNQDSLFWYTEDGFKEAYFVLELNPKRMVLKKVKPPLFAGENQERYELRYFSKLAQ